MNIYAFQWRLLLTINCIPLTRKRVHFYHKHNHWKILNMLLCHVYNKRKPHKHTSSVRLTSSSSTTSLCTEAFTAVRCNFLWSKCALRGGRVKTQKYNMTSFTVFFWLSRTHCCLSNILSLVSVSRFLYVKQRVYQAPRVCRILVKQQTVGGLEINAAREKTTVHRSAIKRRSGSMWLSGNSSLFSQLVNSVPKVNHPKPLFSHITPRFIFLILFFTSC